MGLLDFVNRHRNKFLLLGGAAGAVVVINKVLGSYEKQWQTSSSRGFVHEARKKEINFENIINECNQLCQRMSPMVIDRLQELLDDQELIERLESKRKDTDVQDKVEIWNSLKIKIITRLLSEIYSICFMVCYTRVQMSIIGGKLFASSVAKSSTSTASSNSSTALNDLANVKAYSKYVNLLGSFYDQKFDCLIQPIEDVVNETLKSYSTDYNMGIQDFRTILDKIKHSLSFVLSSSFSTTKVFCLDAEKIANMDLNTASSSNSEPLSEADERGLRSLLAETCDILESADFKRVLECGIEVGYALLLDTLLAAFIKVDSKLKGGNDNGSFSNPNVIKVPLVKILPQIRKKYSIRGDADKKTLVNHLLCLDVLNCFAANVYEAFCVPN